MEKRNPKFAKQVLKRDKVCQVCGATENLQAHHIIPFSIGGADTPENGEALCPSCHASKHPDIPRELFLKTKGECLTTIVSIRFPDEMLESMKQAVEEEGCTIGQQIRQLLREWLRGREQQEQEQEANDGSSEPHR